MRIRRLRDCSSARAGHPVFEYATLHRLPRSQGEAMAAKEYDGLSGRVRGGIGGGTPG